MFIEILKCPLATLTPRWLSISFGLLQGVEAVCTASIVNEIRSLHVMSTFPLL